MRISVFLRDVIRFDHLKCKTNIMQQSYNILHSGYAYDGIRKILLISKSLIK